MDGNPSVSRYSFLSIPSPKATDWGNEIRSTEDITPEWGSGDEEKDWALAAAKGSRRVLEEDPDTWCHEGVGLGVGLGLGWVGVGLGLGLVWTASRVFGFFWGSGYLGYVDSNQGYNLYKWVKYVP